MKKVVVIVNSGDRAIPRPLLEKLIEAAGADTWECIDLPTESRLTKENELQDLPILNIIGGHMDKKTNHV